MADRIILVNSETGEEKVINADKRPKILRAMTVFGKAFRTQATEEGTITISLVAGLCQGLKYKGDLKNGIAAAFLTNAAISTVNGLTNVIQNWKNI